MKYRENIRKTVTGVLVTNPWYLLVLNQCLRREILLVDHSYTNAIKKC